MNTRHKLPEFLHNSYLPVFVDISKDHLDCQIGWPSSQAPMSSQRIDYHVDNLQRWVEQLIADHELDGGHLIEFICEPTGGYQHKLLLIARQYGARIRYVDTERMYNARMITYGNGEKTDPKDPAAICNLHLIGKSRPVSELDRLQQTVRSLSREYEEWSQQAVRARNKIHGLLSYVFVDYTKSTSWTFSPGGQALAREFGFCPQYMVQAGYEEFARRLKLHVPRLRWSTLQALWKMATRSVALTDSELADPRQQQLDELYKWWMYLEARKQKLKDQLTECVGVYEERGWFPRHLPPGVSRWMVVRVLAETGTLQNFSHIRQLWAYLGLKLARRQSGKYKGKVKITKKGSPLVRKLLFQICLPLVKREGWLHVAYRRQNPKGKCNGEGIRAMTSVMRKFLKILLALDRSGKRFCVKRLQRCESQYRPKRRTKHAMKM